MRSMRCDLASRFLRRRNRASIRLPQAARAFIQFPQVKRSRIPAALVRFVLEFCTLPTKPPAHEGPNVFPAPFQADGLRQFRLFESNDIDDTRERISNVMQQHSLVPIQDAGARRRRRARMDFARVGSLGLGTIKFGTGMRVDVDAVDGYYLLMFCLAGNAIVDTQSRSVHVDGSHAIVCAPGERFDARLSFDCEQFVLRLDPAAIAAHTGLSTLAVPSVIDLTRRELQPWMQQLQLVAGSPSMLDCARRDPRVAVEMERLLVSLLAYGFADTSGPPPAARGAARPVAPAFVRRAEEYIDEFADDPLRLSDIAEAVGLPSRTLLDGFRKFRGTSPMQYLRQVRLQRARSALQRAAPGTRVAAIAMECGFAHLGRFAQAYLEAFGETPSDTLRSGGTRSR
jgi:AraC-like DNA-binding protein